MNWPGDTAFQVRLDAQLLDPLVHPSALQVLIIDHAEEEPADEADGGDDAPVDHLVVDPRLALELRRRCRRARLPTLPRDPLRVCGADLVTLGRR